MSSFEARHVAKENTHHDQPKAHSGPGMCRQANETDQKPERTFDRHSQTGFRGVAKKHGGGGKFTWGATEDDATIDPSQYAGAMDENDPNYEEPEKQQDEYDEEYAKLIRHGDATHRLKMMLRAFKELEDDGKSTRAPMCDEGCEEEFSKYIQNGFPTHKFRQLLRALKDLNDGTERASAPEDGAEEFSKYVKHGAPTHKFRQLLAALRDVKELGAESVRGEPAAEDAGSEDEFQRYYKEGHSTRNFRQLQKALRQLSSFGKQPAKASDYTEEEFATLVQFGEATEKLAQIEEAMAELELADKIEHKRADPTGPKPAAQATPAAIAS